MPPISLHMSIALDASDPLPLTPEELGIYLFGSTLPDIHIITQGSRQETHFASLGQEAVEDGVASFWKSHPELSPQAALEPKARALVAGYLSHLVTDQVWVRDIYRPFFGTGSSLGQNPMANIMDRALQYELDRKERENRSRVACMYSLLTSFPTLSLDFLEASSIQRWHQFVLAALGRQLSWSNFPDYARRFLLPHGGVSPEGLDQFLATLSTRLEWILGYITEARLAAFRQGSVDASTKVAREYRA